MNNLKLSKSAIITGITLFMFFFMGLWFVGNYNSLVTSRNAVDNGWSKVETQYQRRLDLIDNIVSSAKGSQAQEQKVFGDIAKARSAYNNAGNSDDKAAAASQIETSIAIIPRLQEAYPELKSNEQITRLINELAGTENGIATSRNTYNDIVTNYNNGIGRFPKSLFANMFGYDKAKLFKADANASTAPKVKL